MAERDIYSRLAADFTEQSRKLLENVRGALKPPLPSTPFFDEFRKKKKKEQPPPIQPPLREAPEREPVKPSFWGRALQPRQPAPYKPDNIVTQAFGKIGQALTKDYNLAEKLPAWMTAPPPSPIQMQQMIPPEAEKRQREIASQALGKAATGVQKAADFLMEKGGTKFAKTQWLMSLYAVRPDDPMYPAVQEVLKNPDKFYEDFATNQPIVNEILGLWPLELLPKVGILGGFGEAMIKGGVKAGVRGAKVTGEAARIGAKAYKASPLAGEAGFVKIPGGTKTFQVTVTQGTIKPKGGVEAPFERTFTVNAKTARAAVKSVRDTGIRVDKVDVREVTKAIPEPARPLPGLAAMPETLAAKQPWEMTWEEIKTIRKQELADTPQQVVNAENKFAEVRKVFDETRAKETKRIKAINTRISRLNPTGDIEKVDSASQRIIANLESERDLLVAKHRNEPIPNRGQFVSQEIPKSTIPPSQKIHLESIQQALAEGKPVPAEVLKDYPDLAKAVPTGAGIEPQWAEVEVLAKDIEYPGALYRTREVTGLGKDYKGIVHFETNPARALVYADRTKSRAIDRYRIKSTAKVYDENISGVISKSNIKEASGNADIVILKAPNTERLVLNPDSIELIPWVKKGQVAKAMPEAPAVSVPGFVAPSPKSDVGDAVSKGLKLAAKTKKDIYASPTAEGMVLGYEPPPFGIQHIILKPDGTHKVVPAGASWQAGRKAGVEPVPPAVLGRAKEGREIPVIPEAPPAATIPPELPKPITPLKEAAIPPKAAEAVPPPVQPPPPGGIMTPEQADDALNRFAKYIHSPESADLQELTVAMRSRQQAAKFKAFEEAVERNLKQGMSYERAEAAAEKMMGGKYGRPARILSEAMADEIREAAFAKLNAVLKDEPSEYLATAEALRNALIKGQGIPRKLGTGTPTFPKGGSAYLRLSRVFPDDVIKILDKKQPLEKSIMDALLKREGELGISEFAKFPKRGFGDIQTPKLIEDELLEAQRRKLIESFGEIPETQMTPPKPFSEMTADELLAYYKLRYPDKMGVGEFAKWSEGILPETKLQQAEIPIPGAQKLTATSRLGEMTESRQLDIYKLRQAGKETLPIEFPEYPRPELKGEQLGIEMPGAQKLTVEGMAGKISEAERKANIDQFKLEYAMHEEQAGRATKGVSEFIEQNPVIAEAIKQPSMVPIDHQHNIVKILKEAGNTTIDIGNFLRAMKSSADFSWWRQQAPLIANNLKSFVKGNADALKALKSQKFSEEAVEAITRHKYYGYYQQFAEAFGHDFLRPLTQKGLKGWQKTEEFMILGAERPIPKLAEKLPWITWAQRSFVTGTNSMNWDIFVHYIDDILENNEKIARGIKKLKPTDDWSMAKDIKAMSSMLSDMTGRAGLGPLKELSPAMNAGFFSMRLNLGRVLTPRHLFSSNAFTRKAAWKTLIKAAALDTSVKMAGKQMGLWEIELDPRSSDFMKIKIGNIRIDTMGGYQQFIVFASRIFTGKMKSARTWRVTDTSIMDTVPWLVRSKLAPLTSNLVNWSTGKNYVGEKMNIKDPKQWLEGIAPFAAWDIYEAVDEEGAAGLLPGSTAIVGAGVATFPSVLWPEETKYYEGIPSSDIELKALQKKDRKVLSRHDARKRKPELDAKMFIQGNATSLLTTAAVRKAIKLIDENDIDPAQIPGVEARLKTLQEAVDKGVTVNPVTIDGILKHYKLGRLIKVKNKPQPKATPTMPPLVPPMPTPTPFSPTPTPKNIDVSDYKVPFPVGLR